MAVPYVLMTTAALGAIGGVSYRQDNVWCIVGPAISCKMAYVEVCIHVYFITPILSDTDYV